MRDRRIDRYLSADRSAIYVDEGVAETDPSHRYRFTLAHEIGHWYLHEDLYAAAQGLGVPSFADFIDDIPTRDWSFYEWQAYSFAGLLLVPQDSRASHVREAIDRAVQEGVPDLDVTIEAHRDFVAEWVGRAFQVSSAVIVKERWLRRTMAQVERIVGPSH